MRRPRFSLRGRRRGRRSGDRFDATVRGNRVTLLHDGAACLGAMMDAIQDAEEEILVEMYWFGSDATGQRFADALAFKARAGVRVRVVYDAVGSIDAADAMFVGMEQAGCEVREYNPIAPWRQRFHVGLVNNRDHRKIVVVDQRVAFTGGVNLGDPWAPPSEGGQGWRDDMIRIEGLAALWLRRCFLEVWRELDGDPAGPTMTEAELRATDTSVPEVGAPVRVLADHWRTQRNKIRRAYLREIDRAEDYVFITNSYFVPGRAVCRALMSAARRGVEVRVLLPGNSDVLAVQFAARRLYAGLMAAGVSLHEWAGPVLHSKTAAIDDRWCTVGTYNFDYRSWRNNLEVSVAIEDEAVARAMAGRFRADLERAVEVDPRDWSARPAADRALEHFFYAFRKLL